MEMVLECGCVLRTISALPFRFCCGCAFAAEASVGPPVPRDFTVAVTGSGTAALPSKNILEMKI